MKHRKEHKSLLNQMVKGPECRTPILAYQRYRQIADELHREPRPLDLAEGKQPIIKVQKRSDDLITSNPRFQSISNEFQNLQIKSPFTRKRKSFVNTTINQSRGQQPPILNEYGPGPEKPSNSSSVVQNQSPPVDELIIQKNVEQYRKVNPDGIESSTFDLVMHPCTPKSAFSRK